MIEGPRKRLNKRAKRGFRCYPLATVPLYGPDDRTAEKLTVGIMPGSGISETLAAGETGRFLAPSPMRHNAWGDCIRWSTHSMTSSARARIDGGTVSPSALAVLRLTISSNVVGCWTGRSAGFSPFRILPA